MNTFRNQNYFKKYDGLLKLKVKELLEKTGKNLSTTFSLTTDQSN